MARIPAEPYIPLKYAELLFVAFSSLLERLDPDEYPVENLRSVLRAYEVRRNKHLRQKGVPDKVIRAYTEAAAESLAQWLEEQAAKRDDVDEHFRLWAEEMNDSADDCS